MMIDQLILELQTIRERWGNTRVSWVRLSWGGSALWMDHEYETKIDALAAELAKQVHGASGMCCALRKEDKETLGVFQREVQEITTLVRDSLSAMTPYHDPLSTEADSVDYRLVPTDYYERLRERVST